MADDVSPVPRYEFGSAQLDLPGDLAQRVRTLAAAIPDHDLAEDGREAHPHVTVQYGLRQTAPTDLAAVGHAVAQHPPVTLTLGKTSLFPASETGGDYDVVKLDVMSDGLHTLRGAIRAATPVTDTHPTYQPHVTLAYVKAGRGARYAGRDDLAGTTATLHQVCLSNREGHATHYPLRGAGDEERSMADQPTPTLAEMAREAAARFAEIATQAERAKIPDEDYGIPDQKLYPITTQAQADSAADLIGKHPEAKARIIAIIRRKGFTLPAAWADHKQADEPTASDAHLDATMGSGINDDDGSNNNSPRMTSSKNTNFFVKSLYTLVRSHFKTHSSMRPDDWASIWKSSRGHAGGKATRSLNTSGINEGLDAGYSMEASEGMEVADLAYRGGPNRLFNLIACAEAPEWVPVLPKPGAYQHPKWGTIAVTPERTQRFVTNFAQRVYQEHIPIDAEHQTKLSGAVGYYRDLRVNPDGSADARVEWTPRGKALIAAEGFKYFSPEWFDEWKRPDDGQVYRDVLIGGAITTRPFFKDTSLRPLVASEAGITELDEESEASMSTPMGMTEEQSRQFAEMQTRLSAMEAERDQAKQASEEATRLARAANESMQLMEADSRHKRFTDEVLGKSEHNGRRWFGGVEEHVGLLESLAQAFGEDSEQVALYVKTQRATAEQLHRSDLLRPLGRDRVGGEDNPSARFEGKVKAMMATEKIGYADAATRAASEDPALYAEHITHMRNVRS